MSAEPLPVVTPADLSEIIEVAFKGNRREFFLWDQGAPPPFGAPVIVDADRGEDLGRVHATGTAARGRCERCAHGLGQALPQRRVIRLATREEARREAELRDQDEVARRRAMERVKANGLIMKLSDAEWQWDRKKLTFYFTAEKRVDFRNLVRDLAAMFRTRIELKQIGVRDEAKRLDGVGRCGRQYCSASWLPELRPVSLGVAKDQHLSLNPSQISGACGRLMCCLRYEHEFYVQSRKRFPKEGRILVTTVGEEKVLANDIFNDRVTLRGPEGDTRVVALADLRRELDRVADGDGPPADVDEAAPAPDVIDGAGTIEAMVDGAVVDLPTVPVPTVMTMEPGAEVLGDIGPDIGEAGAADAGAEEASAAGSEEQRARRRRGRRGGRRGRKAGERGPTPAEE
jgi:cell fate regulator YaaT (PSP1 superfamily)